MKPKHDFLTKHKLLFVYYLFFLKANGDKIHKMPKRAIYISVARPFFIDAQASAKIISKLMRSGYTPTSTDIADFEYTFKEVAEVQAIIDKT